MMFIHCSWQRLQSPRLMMRWLCKWKLSTVSKQLAFDVHRGSSAICSLGEIFEAKIASRKDQSWIPADHKPFDATRRHTTWRLVGSSVQESPWRLQVWFSSMPHMRLKAGVCSETSAQARRSKITPVRVMGQRQSWFCALASQPCGCATPYTSRESEPQADGCRFR